MSTVVRLGATIKESLIPSRSSTRLSGQMLGVLPCREGSDLGGVRATNPHTEPLAKRVKGLAVV